MAVEIDEVRTSEIPAHVPPELVVDFDLYDPPGADRDFHGAWKVLQDRAPDVIWTPRNGGHWIVLRGKPMHEMFADYEHFSSQVLIVPRERGSEIKLKPTMLDPPEHRPYRLLLTSALSPRAVRMLESDIRAVVIGAIEGFKERGRCEFMHEFAEVLPIKIFMKMVDLPIADAQMLKSWVDRILRPETASSAADVMALFANYLRPYIAARRERPGDDLISRMINQEVNGAPLPEHEAIELCTQVLLGGLDTVIAFLGFVMLFLARNPGHRAQLRDEPALIQPAIEEFLRRFPIVQNGRMVVSDYVFHGVEMKAGDLVILPGVLHGVDEREHENPLEVDFKRQSVTNSTFGNGIHRCPGAMLARSELRITLEEWLPRIPDFDLDPNDAMAMQGGIVATVTRLPLRWPAGG